MCVDEAKDTLLPCDVPWDMRMALGSGYGWWLTLDGVSRAWNYCSPDAVHCYSCCKSNCSFPLFEFTPKFSFSYQNVFHFLSRVKTNDVLFRELISFPSLLVGTAQADESSQSVCVCVGGLTKGIEPPGRTGARWLGWVSYSSPPADTALKVSCTPGSVFSLQRAKRMLEK